LSRADPATKLLAAAAALGARDGVAALSIQGIADAADTSKALVLYHFTDKAALLVALHGWLCTAAAERLEAAAMAADPLDAWRALTRAEIARGEATLLVSLANDEAVRGGAAREAERARERAAASLATAVLSSLDLEPRVSPELLGRTLLRHLDGVAVAHGARRAEPLRSDAVELEDELDAFALALLALGR
jgi:AcrR family transcriptional regulator